MAKATAKTSLDHIRTVQIEQYFLKKQRIIENPDMKKLDERHIKPAGRTLASAPVERLIYAEKF